MTVRPFSSDDADRLPPPVPAAPAESDDGRWPFFESPLLDTAIDAWRDGVPTVNLAQRVVAEWQRQPVVPDVETFDGAPLVRVVPKSPATRGGRFRNRLWLAMATAAACILLIALWNWPDAARQPDLATADTQDSADEGLRATESPLANPAHEPASIPGVESPAVVTATVVAGDAPPPVTEFVGDAKAAVSELTADATSAVKDLLAMAWVDGATGRSANVPTGQLPGADPVQPLEGTPVDGTRVWGWTTPPLGGWKDGLQPVGRAVDFLYERLGDDATDGTRSDATKRPESLSTGRTL